MNDLTVFVYNNKHIRTIQKGGEVWWVLKDVCDVLGISKYRDTASRLDEDERTPIRVDTLGGNQEMICINESGLYNVIFKSPVYVPSIHFLVAFCTVCIASFMLIYLPSAKPLCLLLQTLSRLFRATPKHIDM